MKVTHLPVKRIFDILISLLVLTLGLPVFLVIALAVRISSPGQVIYSQERVGRGGKLFPCYKFRTMYPDADARLEQILARCPQLRAEWKIHKKLKNDPRVTKVGLFLRKTSLDELPQFWNVLTGDLSVVGPRPVVKSEVTEYFGFKAAKILSVRPGLTGLWQVSGRNDLSYEQRVHLDEKYIDHRNMLMDMKLILKTVPQMISKKGAY